MPKLRHSTFYGDSKRRTLWLIVSDDGETELNGPMTETDARAFLGLLEAAKPFAQIIRSTFCSEDEDEGYAVVLSDHLHIQHREFTGQDIERLQTAYRTAMKEG